MGDRNDSGGGWAGSEDKGDFAPDTPEGDRQPLSRREGEVLGLVARGLTNRQIAADLFISPETVKTHVARLCRKLGARNRTEAVARAASLQPIAGHKTKPAARVPSCRAACTIAGFADAGTTPQRRTAGGRL